MTRPEREVVIVAHRGMAAGYPENTLTAFRHSVSAGFPVIEVDLRTTADGHIVIMHDETVDRTTSGTGEVGPRFPVGFPGRLRRHGSYGTSAA